MNTNVLCRYAEFSFGGLCVGDELLESTLVLPTWSAPSHSDACMVMCVLFYNGSFRGISWGWLSFSLYIMGLSWRSLSWQIKSIMRPHGNSSWWLSFFTDFISALLVPTWQDLKALKRKKRNTARFQICKSNSGRTARKNRKHSYDISEQLKEKKKKSL